MEKTSALVERRAGPGQLVTPHSPPPILALPAIPPVGATFQDTDLREQCAAGAIWTEYVTEPREGLYVNLLRFRQAGMEVCSFCGRPGQTSLSALAYYTCPYQSGVFYLFLQSLRTLRVHGPGQISSRKLLS